MERVILHRFLCLISSLAFAATPAKACDLALLMAVDISGSVDTSEYDIQMQGIAAGLRDGLISEALIKGSAAIAVVQWTGRGRQEMSVPWVQVDDFEDVEALAQLVENSPRAWRNYSTAIGEALQYSINAFQTSPECDRQVIDMSGDGVSNEGVEPADIRAMVQRSGVTVNALVIEGAQDDLTGYFWENVISGPGAFVVTANGFEEYSHKMRRKLIREITKQVSELSIAEPNTEG